MQVRGRHLLEAFGRKHVAAEAPLKQWDRLVSVLTVNRPEEWAQHVSKVSTVGHRCTVFNIGGNKYRISATVDYEFQVIRVHEKEAMAQTAFQLDKPRIIRTAEAHEAALRELDRLMAKQPRRGSKEGDQLELLSLLIGDYESRTVTLGGKSTPQSIVEFMVDQHDVSSGELAALLGGRSSLSLFRRGRPLSKGQIARLRARMGIPVELLFETEPVAGNAARRRRPAAIGASGRGRKNTASTRSR